MKWIIANGILLVSFFLLPLHPVASALLVMLVNGLLVMIERQKRSEKINELNNYLSALNRGHHKSQVTTYEEGELSILQSELYKLSVTLSHQNDLLKQNHQFIQDSLNDIAHQIKTPLTSMMVMTDLMQDMDLPPEKQKEFVSSIQKQLERLKTLVTSLLTLSKLDAGVIHYQPSWINDSELIKKVIEPFGVISELKDIQLETQVSNQEVYIDASWTIEALGNLVKNAIEHSSQNETIKIRSMVNQLYWRIEIEDEGLGIDAQDLDHIFERFYRGKNSSSDSVGIGLSLTQKIITQQQGQIFVVSKVNEGTLFKIEFSQKKRG